MESRNLTEDQKVRQRSGFPLFSRISSAAQVEQVLRVVYIVFGGLGLLIACLSLLTINENLYGALLSIMDGVTLFTLGFLFRNYPSQIVGVTGVIYSALSIWVAVQTPQGNIALSLVIAYLSLRALEATWKYGDFSKNPSEPL